MKPIILVTNDDGITSKGIAVLVDVAKNFGNVVVVAPNKPQSGMGHAITIGEPLRVERSTLFSGIDAYECSGTPADCVKLAKNHILKDQKPSLVLSGINHGSNTSVSIIYSGTMSAAIEAAIEGIPSVGFSFCNYDHSTELDHLKPWIEKVIKQIVLKPLAKGVALNVNFPDVEEIKGIKLCRQANAKWQEVFEQRKDPYGKKYFWLAGDFVNLDDSEDTDEWAIDKGYASIVPCKYDLTSYDSFSRISEDWDLGFIN